MKGLHFANRLQTDKATVSEIHAFVAKAAPSSRCAMGGCGETNIRYASDGLSKATRSKAESGLKTILCSHLMCLQMLSLPGSETFGDAWTLQTLYADAVGC